MKNGAEKKRKFLRERRYKKEEDGEKQEGERNGVNLKRVSTESSKKEEKKLVTGLIVEFFKHPQYVFFFVAQPQ